MIEDEAREVAQAVVLRNPHDVELNPDGPLYVDDDYIVWVYNTKAYWAGDTMATLAGNGPIVVDRQTGNVDFLPTAYPWKESLEELRGSRGA